MVRDARQGHHASSGLLPAGAQVLAVAACPVALTGRSNWPVLVGAKLLDAGVVSSMAERAGGAVAISDGRRVLVAATAGASGGSDDVAALRQAIDVSAPGLLTIGEATVAALPLTAGLRVMVAVTPPPVAAGGL